jgi:superfamily II DNA/RNA helicase
LAAIAKGPILTDGAFLQINESLRFALGKRGISAPTPIQAIVIPQILAKENLVFRSATGSGKTFAYLLPLLHNLAAERAAPPPGSGLQEAGPPAASHRRRPPAILIMAPTLELAAQIKSEADFLLNGLPIKAILCTGGGSSARQSETLKKEAPEIVVGNPNRLAELFQKGKLKLAGISAVVLDEADRLISREQIEVTAALLRSLPPKCQNIALSATVSNKTIKELNSITGLTFNFSETPPNEAVQGLITHWAIWCDEKNKFFTVLRSFLAAVKHKKVIVFTENARDVETLGAKLQHCKQRAVCIYSGQEKKSRKAALDAFRGSGADVLVSSDLAARGLDFDFVTHVVILGVNESADVYTHRAGRTGRCGRKGVCVSIGDEIDMRRLQNIEKKLKIIVYPKELYGGRILSPDAAPLDE